MRGSFVYFILASFYMFASDFLANLPSNRFLAISHPVHSTLWLLWAASAVVLYFFNKKLLDKHVVSREELAASEERFRLAMMGANDGLWDWDMERGGVYYSPRWKSMLGYEEHELEATQESWIGLLHPEDRDRVVAQIQALRDAATAHYEVELRLRHKNGSYRHMLARGQLTRDAGGRPLRMIGTHLDVTDQRVAEAALRDSEQRLRCLFDQAAVGMAMVDPRTDRYSRVNKKYCDILGYSMEEMLQLGFRDVTHPDDLEGDLAELQLLVRGEKNTFSREKRYLTKDGSLVWGNLTISSIRSEEGNLIGFAGVLEDITLRKRNEEILQSYTRRLMELEEELRKRIARELHDDVGQDLTALGLNLSFVSNRLWSCEDQELQLRIDDSKLLTKEINRNVRNLMTDLRPPQLEAYGLSAALDSYGKLFFNRTGVVVTISVQDELPRLEGEVEIALYRIVQEALTNVAKHAEATQVLIAFMHQSGVVRLRITDNGKGFSPRAVPPVGSGWGLTIMRERSELIGASFRVDSAPKRGTTLDVELTEGT